MVRMQQEIARHFGALALEMPARDADCRDVLVSSREPKSSSREKRVQARIRSSGLAKVLPDEAGCIVARSEAA